ncbi:TIGR03773 family transporter-associated surface protein [Streptomyces sp. NPDC088757]|uniref:TIGR03773 family transporter-associated surface protein n=1 Tax=Streptomyces sp. NPDC088757 TaxID=3365889 RepID=UPI00381E0385
MNTAPTRVRRRAATAALLLALSPALPAVAVESPSPGAESDAAPETGTGRTVIADGHIDMGPRFDHGTWTVQIRDDTTRPATWRDTDDVVLRVADAAKVRVPDGAEFSFLGKPGEQVWLLPQVQSAGVLWPGWNSQEPQVAARVAREVTWQLTSVRGPGDFVLFLNGSFGTPKILFDGRKKLPQETGIELNSHVHGNWAFTEPGTYLLGVRMSATTKDGEHHDDQRTLRFSVGSQDPQRAFAAAPPATTGSAPAASGPRASPVPAASGDSTAPLWWGAGGAAVIATGAGALMWRRREDEHPAPAAPGGPGSNGDEK